MNLQSFTTPLARATRDAVAGLAARAQASDGRTPLNEEAHLLLTHPGATHVVASHGESVVGYAQWQPDAATGQIVVDPAHRRRGIGTALLAALPARTVWAFGNLDAARAFAEASGLAASRELLVMGRPLPADLGGPLPDGVTLGSYTDADQAAFLRVNALAFASHPEQGAFDAADLAARQAEPWWDPHGLIIAKDAEGVAGFHWTKVHPDGQGEVYVIGVHPRMTGRRLGAPLLQAGLDRLTAQGCTDVILYVDGDNRRAVDLYTRNGFSTRVTDVLYHG